MAIIAKFTDEDKAMLADYWNAIVGAVAPLQSASSCDACWAARSRVVPDPDRPGDSICPSCLEKRQAAFQKLSEPQEEEDRWDLI